MSSDFQPLFADTDTTDYDVEALRREEFPWADRAVFLNHASLGPLPQRPRRRLEEYNRVRAEAHRLTDEHFDRVFARSRVLAAALIDARPDEIALGTNTSAGINLAAATLPLGAGDIVLASHGEFPANVFPWREQARRGVTLELVPCTPDGWPDEDRLVERMQDPAVKVLALSLVQFHTGFLADVNRLSRAARETGTWLVLDAIQGVGQVPFSVAETHVDILACGAQKWLLSPWGSGFTYIRSELIEALEPATVGWTAFEGTDDYATLLSYAGAWRKDARRFEVITLPFQDFAGMNSSVELLLELGVEDIQRHLRRIGRPVLEWAARRGVPLASPVGAHQSGIISLRLPNPGRVHAELKRQDVIVSLRDGMIRLSPHCYNTIDEMARVAQLLDRLV